MASRTSSKGVTVRIRVERRVASVVITVDNLRRDCPAGRGTGLGLRNVRQRLDSAYGGQVVLHTGEANGSFVARVEIPADTRS